MEKYFGRWSDLADVVRDFALDEVPSDFPTDQEIILACYVYEDYSGSAWVIYEKDGTLYEVHGSHCSCYGLEGQWSPEDTLAAALGMRSDAYLSSSFPQEFIDALHDRFPPVTV